MKETTEERKLRIYYKKIDNENKLAIKKELAILNFMKKTDVYYYHHNRKESLKSLIKEKITSIKETNNPKEYNSYIWNYQDSDYMSKSLLGNIFSSSEFETIYDVPLDGTYIFSVYDSGTRGLCSFNRITVTKIEEELNVPYVNPGALIPITAN